MTIGWEAVADVDWTRVFHAYGAAVDTPDHLRALTDGDAAARSEALEHLEFAVIHQGTPWTATVPAALVVAGLLADPATAEPIDEDGRPLRAALLDFLDSVATAGHPDIDDEKLNAMARPPGVPEKLIQKTYKSLLGDENPAAEEGDDEEEGQEVDRKAATAAWDAVIARVVLEIRSTAPALLPPVEAALDDEDPRVRAGAANAAAWLSALPGLEHRRDAVAAKVEHVARRAPHRDERAALVLSLGDLGAAPREFLADPDPAVRACAALAPALARDPAAFEELLTALRRPAEADAWFTHRPPQFPAHVRFTLVDAVLHRATDFEQLLPTAVAIAQMTNDACYRWDWGRLLAAAFPDPGDPPTPPTGLTDAQRTYLRALVENEDLWGSEYFGAHMAFEQVGLPYDRDAIRALIEAPS
ncbi:UNVERIFIED_ORG: hypothetical protein CLV66_11622 [Actinomadura viridilutea]|nr:hypothetical protein [Actinomadura rubrobrunea]